MQLDVRPCWWSGSSWMLSHLKEEVWEVATSFWFEEGYITAEAFHLDSFRLLM